MDRERSGKGRLGTPARLLAVALAVLALGGCLGDGYRYVAHSSTQTYLKLPETWKVFSQDEVIRSASTPLSADAIAGLKRQQWEVGFDADGHPSLTHLLNAGADHPAGMVRVRKLASSEHDAASLAALRTEVLTNDPLQSTPGGSDAEVLRYQEVSRSGGFHGSRMTVGLKSQDGTPFTLDQLAFLDGKASTIYVLFVGCSTTCYNANRSTIDRVLASWTLKGH